MVIGEFSRITGISAYTLRYYEKKGLIRVDRDHGGRRDYSEADIEWVKFIKRLKDTGMLLRDIKYYSDLRYEGDTTMEKRMEFLVQHRKSVVEERNRWDGYLHNLDEKISIYQKKLKETDGDITNESFNRNDKSFQSKEISRIADWM